MIYDLERKEKKERKRNTWENIILFFERVSYGHDVVAKASADIKSP